VIELAQTNWRTAVSLAIQAGVAVPAFSASLAYSTVIAKNVYRPICYKLNAITSARILTNARTNPACSTPNG
jgi:6-phosphogluconate dehydrogenase